MYGWSILNWKIFSFGVLKILLCSLPASNTTLNFWSFLWKLIFFFVHTDFRLVSLSWVLKSWNRVPWSSYVFIWTSESEVHVFWFCNSSLVSFYDQFLSSFCLLLFLEYLLVSHWTTFLFFFFFSSCFVLLLENVLNFILQVLCWIFPILF